MTNLTNHPKTTQLALRERPSKSLVSSRCSVGTYSHLHTGGDEMRLLLYCWLIVHLRRRKPVVAAYELGIIRHA